MITIKQVFIRDLQHLRTLFNDFDAGYQPRSMFASMAWLEAWISSLASMPELTVFYREKHVLGFVVLAKQAVHPALPMMNRVYVNQSGLQQFDQVWIEFNQIYCSIEHRHACTEALLQAFPQSAFDMQLHISMTANGETWGGVASELNLASEVDTTPGYKKLLTPDMTADSIIAALSRSSRSQIRRAWRKAESLCGRITVEVAESENKLEWLSALGQLHKARWQHTLEGSGFDNPAFVAHHSHLITHAGHMTDLVTVKAGEHTLGFCYNFLCGDRVEFYCSGINEEVPDKHIKPGYLVHVALMAHYCKLGFQEYDFLGGDAQYKRTLADTQYAFYTVSVWANTLPARVMRGLATLKSAIRRVF